jgi:hypothetical protein
MKKNPSLLCTEVEKRVVKDLFEGIVLEDDIAVPEEQLLAVHLGEAREECGRNAYWAFLVEKYGLHLLESWRPFGNTRHLRWAALELVARSTGSISRSWPGRHQKIHQRQLLHIRRAARTCRCCWL